MTRDVRKGNAILVVIITSHSSSASQMLWMGRLVGYDGRAETKAP